MIKPVLADATSPDVDRGAVLVVPVGSVEQHGPHLPVDTDTAVAVAVTERVVARLVAHTVDALVAPPIAYGSSGEHQGFAGTVSIGADALHGVLVELVRSARTWAGTVVFVNGHGGNAATLDRAVDQLTVEGHDVVSVSCSTPSGDLHAGRVETSLMHHLRPESVRAERASAGNVQPLHEIMPTMAADGVVAVSSNGVLGDPAGASSAEGRALLEGMVDRVERAILARIQPAGHSR